MAAWRYVEKSQAFFFTQHGIWQVSIGDSSLEVKGLGGKTLSRRLINPVNIKLMEIGSNLIFDLQAIERFGDKLVELARKVSITIFSCFFCLN